MQSRRVYLDTNIVIRAFEGASDDALAQAMVGMFGLVKPGTTAPFVTSHITLAETLVGAMKQGAVQAQARYKMLLSTTSHWLLVRHIDQEVLVEAARLRSIASIKLPDAIHAATALLTGCTHVLTSDGDFQARGLAELPPTIRPTIDTIDDIKAWLRA